jgi:hypothetical protein
MRNIEVISLLTAEQELALARQIKKGIGLLGKK